MSTETKENTFTEREFTYKHNGYLITATVWNEASAPDPIVLYDYNNVLNAYTMEELQKEGGLQNLPYAIVSLIGGKGQYFQNLMDRAKEKNECIVALTAKIRGDRVNTETCLKYVAMKKMHWKNVKWAVDDKPHEWYKTPTNKVGKKIKLDENKKDVYRIPIYY